MSRTGLYRPEERKFGWPRLRMTEAPGLTLLDEDDIIDECRPMTSAQLRTLTEQDKTE